MNDESEIVFFDTRSAKILTVFSECHSDDVTNVKFHPTRPELMMSGSTDRYIRQYAYD